MPKFTPVEFLENEIKLCTEGMIEATEHMNLAYERVEAYRAKRTKLGEELHQLREQGNIEDQLPHIQQDMLNAIRSEKRNALLEKDKAQSEQLDSNGEPTTAFGQVLYEAVKGMANE